VSLADLKQPKNLYLLTIYMIGTGLFLLFGNFPIYSLEEWVLLYALVASVVVLNQLAFQLPPKGTRQSMDSAVLLATLFVYGLEMSLYVLFFSYIIYVFVNRKMALWKHAANFSMYTIMIISTAFCYELLGGTTGFINILHIYVYAFSLLIYFTLNNMIIGGFHFVHTREPYFTVLNGIFKESISAYASTLLLSIVLTILLESSKFFGLFLFMGIAVLISKSFRLLFQLYTSLSERAIRDQRTGLYNHGYFEDALEEELKRARMDGTVFALALLDIDDFKKYNDAFGHLRGDQLLEFFGSQLKEQSGNHLVARYGGEEFAIIIRGLNLDQSYHFLNKMRKQINDTYFEGVELFPHGCLSFSAGIAVYTKGVYDKNQLVERADHAMYYAKAQGKNAIHIYNEDSLLQRTIDIEADIHEIEHQLNIFLSKDVYTFQHSKRVYRYALELSDRLALPDAEKKTLILGALIHDIGKLEIPRDVLNKKGKLTQEEWEMVKKHVLWGKEIASTNVKFKLLLPLIELHHERYDGSGYPRGLKGEEIPKLARMLCVIDSFDAMTTERPYQKTKTFTEAIVELRKFAGIQFDPVFVEAFISIIEEKCEEKEHGAADSAVS
jgi:diguanylate cyclase (GGDEF)-like protein